ncbi:MAG: hypothetical protein ACR2PY_07335 [Salinispira sp.]
MNLHRIVGLPACRLVQKRQWRSRAGVYDKGDYPVTAGGLGSKPAKVPRSLRLADFSARRIIIAV